MTIGESAGRLVNELQLGLETLFGVREERYHRNTIKMFFRYNINRLYRIKLFKKLFKTFISNPNVS